MLALNVGLAIATAIYFSNSIPNLTLQPIPLPKRLISAGQLNVMHGDITFSRLLGDFVVDETVVETGLGGVEAVAGEIDGGESGPINGP